MLIKSDDYNAGVPDDRQLKGSHEFFNKFSALHIFSGLLHIGVLFKCCPQSGQWCWGSIRHGSQTQLQIIQENIKNINISLRIFGRPVHPLSTNRSLISLTMLHGLTLPGCTHSLTLTEHPWDVLDCQVRLYKCYIYILFSLNNITGAEVYSFGSEV